MSPSWHYLLHRKVALTQSNSRNPATCAGKENVSFTKCTWPWWAGDGLLMMMMLWFWLSVPKLHTRNNCTRRHSIQGVPEYILESIFSQVSTMWMQRQETNISLMHWGSSSNPLVCRVHTYVHICVCMYIYMGKCNNPMNVSNWLLSS